MSVVNYKCAVCNVVPQDEFVHQCKQKHIVCNECKKGYNCKCNAALIKIKNPLNVLIERVNIKANSADTIPKEPCKYQADGCTWSFSANKIGEHIAECKYRPYKCIGDALHAWRCTWIGRQYEFDKHFLNIHKNIDLFTYFQKSNIKFNGQHLQRNIHLVTAFNKYFIFYYKSCPLQKKVYFIIFIIGRKDNAEKYFYEFKVGENDFCHVKFTQNCLTDNDDIRQAMKDEKSIVLPHGTLKKYLISDMIPIRFILKQK